MMRNLISKHLRLISSRAAFNTKNTSINTNAEKLIAKEYPEVALLPKGKNLDAIKAFHTGFVEFLRPTIFEMPEKSYNISYIPFYILDVKCNVTVNAEVGYSTGVMQKSKISPNYSIVESNDMYFWCKIPERKLQVSSRDDYFEFVDVDSKGFYKLDLFADNMIYAGPPEYLHVLTPEKIENFIDWDNAENNKLFHIPENMSRFEPFLRVQGQRRHAIYHSNHIDREKAKSLYMDKMKKKLEEAIKDKIFIESLAEDIRNLDVKISVTSCRTTLASLPFFSTEHTWGPAKLYYLFDATNFIGYRDSLYSPSKAFMLSACINFGIIKFLQNNGIEIPSYTEYTALIYSTTIALFIYAIPIVRYYENVRKNLQSSHSDNEAVSIFGLWNKEEPSNNESNDKKTDKNTEKKQERKQPQKQKQPENTQTSSTSPNEQVQWKSRRKLRFASPKAEMKQIKIKRDPLGIYKILELNGDESQEEINAAYIKMAKRYHPDLHSDELAKEQAKQNFHRVSYAYQILKNESKRAEYDMRGKVKG